MEFAIVAVLLFTLLLGIIEFGMLIKDFLALNQASREGVRSAALRSPYDTVVDRVTESSTTLDPARITVVEPYYRVYDPAVGAWGDWQPYPADGQLPPGVQTYNTQVRMHAQYQHKLITGNFFAWMAAGNDYLTVSSDMVMKRE